MGNSNSTPLIAPADVTGAALVVPENFPQTLAQLIAHCSETWGEDRGVIQIAQQGDELRIGYRSLHESAIQIAKALRAANITPGSLIAFQIDQPIPFFVSFWACMIGGYVAVPITTPPQYSDDNATVVRMRKAWELLGQPVFICNDDRVEPLRNYFSSLDSVAPQVFSVTQLNCASAVENPPLPEPEPDDLAVLFLTSGSTGVPKAVSQTHRSLITMALGTIQMNGFKDTDISLNWMPTDHVGSLSFLGILPLALGADQVHVDTSYVLRDPFRWLELLNRYRASIAWAPNFAFSLFLKQRDRVDESPWDLSCLWFLVNAGEAVSATTAHAFAGMLAPKGLPSTALRPAFGMSETCSGITWSKGFDFAAQEKTVSLGGPIPSARLKIVDEKSQTLPEGVVGRLLVSGPSVTKGYLNASDANKECFADQWLITGDLGYILRGELYITGREKEILIINGANLHCHEIEQSVESLPDCVTQTFTAACSVRAAESPSDELALFYVPLAHGSRSATETATLIRSKISESFGVRVTYLVPVDKQDIPKTEIGKIQRLKLKTLFEQDHFSQRTIQTGRNSASRTADRASVPTVGNERMLRQQITKIWEEALKTTVGLHETFFELGGHSLLIPQIQEQLERLLERPIRVTELFNLPTVADLARYFSNSSPAENGAQESDHLNSKTQPTKRDSDIAIIGMAGKFPGATNLTDFWRNLIAGEESISFFTDEELRDAGVSPELISNPDYVKAGPVLEGAELFDAEFFNIPAKDARMMDPQHRVFLETSWEAFEDAGYNPLTFGGRVGVYASTLLNTYLVNNLYANQDYVQRELGGRLLRVESMGGFNLMINNDKDYLPTRVAYKLNLKGPAINVQTACSSTLVAVHVACESIQQGDCDMALAGGVSVSVPQKAGHLFTEGMINCPDGHCRAYDSEAGGTIFGNGSGAILLKRLDQALEDGDSIYAVIKGTASNNDGGTKVGYTAPSEDGEARAIADAYRKANISPESVAFVEGHGTGTQIGDPIEVEALTKVFRRYTTREQFCRIGSVKSNIGHMQVASGIAGMIKACLSVHHGKIPATLHFKKPNPRLQWEQTPFLVNTTSEDWPDANTPRRASVNSLGIGGTNAHVVIEQAPSKKTVYREIEGPFLLPLSSRSVEGLNQLKKKFSAHTKNWNEEAFPDIAFTSQIGRAHWESRKAFIFDSREQLMELLSESTDTTEEKSAKPNLNEVTFLFTGQGSQYHKMGHQFYATNPVFKEAIDSCHAILESECEISLNNILFDSIAPESINATENTQPALFAIEYALARVWLQLGIEPQYLIGHSIGEYVAATIANVFSLKDALRLVAARAKAMANHGGEGIMLAATCSEEEGEAAIKKIDTRVAIAAINGPASIVLSGPSAAANRVGDALKLQGHRITQLAVSHPFHSAQMEPAIAAFRAVAETVQYSAPERTIISNLSGKPATNDIATPDYWIRHIVEPVRFHDSIQEVQQRGSTLMLEIGPHPVLSSMIKQSWDEASPSLIPSLRKGHSDNRTFLTGLASCYEWGAEINWTALHYPKERSRCHLPTYAWQRKRHWVNGVDLKTRTTERSQFVQNARLESAHPMIGDPIDSPLFNGLLFDSWISPDATFIRDHQVFNDIVIPAAGHLSATIHAAAEFTASPQIKLRNLVFPRAFVLHNSRPSRIQLMVKDDQLETNGSATIQIASKQGDAWVIHANASLDSPHHERSRPHASIPSSLRNTTDGTTHYQAMAHRQIDLGPSYHWIHSGMRENNTAWIQLKTPPIDSSDWDLSSSLLHPGFIDSLLQSVVFATDIPQDATYVPYTIDTLTVFDRFPLIASDFWARATVKEQSTKDGRGRIRSDVTLFSTNGEALLDFQDFEIREITTADFQKNSSFSTRTGDLDEFEIRWQLEPSSESLSHEHETNDERVVLLIHSETHQDSRTFIEQFKHVNPDVMTEEVAIEGLINETISESVRPVINSRRWSSVLYLGCMSSTIGHNPKESETFFTDHLHAIKHLLTEFSQEMASAPPFWFVTQFAQRVQFEPTVNVTQTAIWGLVRSLQQEFPEFAFHLADYDMEPESLAPLAIDILSQKRENEIAYRSGKRHFGRLTPVTATTDSDSKTRTPAPGPNIRSDASYIVTGGFGALGFQTVEKLRDSGARSICIVSRTDHSLEPEVATALKRLHENSGITISTVVGAIDDPAIAKKAVSTANKLGPLRGIIHCAGVLQDGLFMDADPDRFNRTFSTKVNGAWALHESSHEANLDFFILYSSIASIIGSAGQTAYSAANAGLDGFANYRRSQNLPCTVFNWGPWEEIGMASRLSETMQRRLTKRGIKTIPVVSGLNALSQSLRADDSRHQRIIMPIHVSSFSRSHHGRASLYESAFFAPGSEAPRADQDGQLRHMEAIKQLPPNQRFKSIGKIIRQFVGEVLGTGPDAIQTDVNLIDQGLDSLMSVDLKIRLEAALGMRLSAALIYDYPNIDQLAQAIEKRLFPKTENEETVTAPVNQTSEASLEKLTEAELEAQLAAELEGESS